MKYHTLSTSSLAAENKEIPFTNSTRPGFISAKMDSTETAIVRCELEMVQRALDLQTRRCRHLVSEFTRKLQDKELQVISERRLRDDQLTKVLRSLLIFEARLKQEQTFIHHQLDEKDDVIQRQKKQLRRLQTQYCKTCSQFYSGSNIDSCDSGSEYNIGHQEVWESGSELYGSIPENHSSSGEEHQHSECDDTKTTRYVKIHDGSYSKRYKKTNICRRITGTYFEVLKSGESSADSSLEDAYNNLSESHKFKEQIKEVSDRIEEMFAEGTHKNDTYSGRIDFMHGIKGNHVADVHSPEDHTVSLLSESSDCKTKSVCNIQPNPALFNDPDSSILMGKGLKDNPKEANPVNENLSNEKKEIIHMENTVNKSRLISDTIPVFDAGDGEQNDNWYASASDPEDDGQRDLYRNNPVLECMNQILLQNINDANNSPPKSPELDRNTKSKSQKRVKFSDEYQDVSLIDLPTKTQNSSENSFKKENNDTYQSDYYETPVQVGSNFYEVPQSIYSNDYELIISKCGGDSIHSWSGSLKAPSPTSKIENLQENQINRMATQKLTIAKCNNLNTLEHINQQHYYIDMETGATIPTKQAILKKTKVAQTPPALPPKPANLVSKFRMQNISPNKSCEHLDNLSVDSEPDYCSISELNLPTANMIMSHSTLTVTDSGILNNSSLSQYDAIPLDGTLSSHAQKKIEKNTIQVLKQPQINNGKLISNVASNAQEVKHEPEIPKLPQVSEIIIPEETEEIKQVEHISQDNYIKNNSQLLKKNACGFTNDKVRNRIIIGTSVSNLVSSFNNQHTILSQIGACKVEADKCKRNDRLFSSFGYPRNYEKQTTSSEKPICATPTFEKFDLSQNFEEFNLDDCEIGEDYQSDISNYDYETQNETKECATNSSNILETEVNGDTLEVNSNTSVEIVRATKDVYPHSTPSLQQLQRSLSSQRNSLTRENEVTQIPVVSRNPEPSYEHFLECTGLSSKSILTPSHMLTSDKNMLKPKDIKLRSRVKGTGVFEHSNGTVKYWSEPYL